MKADSGIRWLMPPLRLLALAAIVLQAVLVSPAFARRATEEEMDRMAKTVDDYCENIREGYSALDGLLLKRGKVDTDKVLARLGAERKAAKDALDRAIYGYLLARAHYWHGFHEFKATRKKEVFDAARPEVVREFLAAFGEVTSLEGEDPKVRRVRTDVAQAFAAALQTNIWGKGLPAETRERVVTEFVDVVEKLPDRDELLASNKGVRRMYTNLGIEDRLAAVIPDELPDNLGELIALVQKAQGRVRGEDLLLVLEAIERGHRAELAKSGWQLAVVADAFGSVGRRRKAFEYMALAAPLENRHYLDLYLMSFDEELEQSPEEQRAYLQGFLDGACPPREEPVGTHRYSRQTAYDRAVAGLRRTGRYAECLALIDEYEKDTTFEHVSKGAMTIVLAKGHCLEELGKRRPAIAAYEGFLAETRDWGEPYACQRRWAEQRVQELKRQ